MEQRCISVYTDGACKNNGRQNAVAGIGVFFGTNDARNVSERIVGKQTNNAAELMAIIRACNILRDEISKDIVNIHTDSEYAIKCATTYGAKLESKGWKQGRKGIPNLELVKELYTVVSESPNIRLHHVRAHTGGTDIHSVSNAHADRLANEAIDEKVEPIPVLESTHCSGSSSSSTLKRLTQLENRVQKIEVALHLL